MPLSSSIAALFCALFASSACLAKCASRAQQPMQQTARLGTTFEQKWEPQYRLQNISEGKEKMPAAEVLFKYGIEPEGVTLAQWLKRLRQDLDAEEEERSRTLEANCDSLLASYAVEDEKSELGPNPRMEPGLLTYDFTRISLPRLVEFHGEPDFVPLPGVPFGQTNGNGRLSKSQLRRRKAAAKKAAARLAA